MLSYGLFFLLINVCLVPILLMVFLGRPLFSIDIHPDGSRFVIGGQGGYGFCFEFNLWQ